MLEIEQKLLPEGHKARPGYKLRGPNSITVHWIGPYPQQSVYDVHNWWLTGGGEAAAHYVIKDDKCIQCIPADEVAWHCGCKEGNYTSIGIEVIPADKTGIFSAASIATLRALIGTINKNLSLKRHFDWAGKDCPYYYTPMSIIKDGDAHWDALIKELKP